MLFANLNRRHKVILFLTLVLTGLSLVAGCGLRSSLGVALLGCSVAWAVGSDSFSRLVSGIQTVKRKVDKKSKILDIVAAFAFVLLVVAGVAVIIDQLDPNAKDRLPLWVPFVAFPLALTVYKQAKKWGGKSKVK